jgi:hypothetical protein
MALRRVAIARVLSTSTNDRSSTILVPWDRFFTAFASADSAWWQDRLTPAWKRISGGCHLNRKMDDLVQAAGFRLNDLKTGYLPGPKPLTFMYEGRARPG